MMLYRLRSATHLSKKKNEVVLENDSLEKCQSFNSSGAVFVSSLSHIAKTIEELAEKIMISFSNVEKQTVIHDAKGFFDSLVNSGFLVKGNTLAECNAMEYGWGYNLALNACDNSKTSEQFAFFHLPGLFSHYNFYKKFLPVFYNYSEFFYPWAKIGSIYGSPAFAIWNSGRARGRSGKISAEIDDVISLLSEYGISGRFTFSNSLLTELHLTDTYCNFLCKKFQSKNNGIIIASDLLKKYISKNFSDFHFISSTTKCLNNFDRFIKELKDETFKYVVPDYNFNNNFEALNNIPENLRSKVEFLCDESCMPNCPVRKQSYERISQSSLFIETDDDFVCPDKRPFTKYFSRIKKNKTFISRDLITEKYMPMGFCNFKLEGREYGESRLLEEILYYLAKPEAYLEIREMLYLNPYVDFPTGRRP